MIEIAIKASLFGGSIELPSSRLEPFNQVLLSEFSNRISEILEAPMAPERFRLRIGDALFSYDLFCSFFGDNVQVKKSAERVSLMFKNGRLRSDLDFIGTRTARFLNAFASGQGQVIFLSGFCHGACRSQSERDTFLAQFAVEEAVIGPGLTGRVKVNTWPEPIRVTSEASFVVPGGLFINWETSYTKRRELKGVPEHQNSEVSERIGPSFGSAAEIFGLKLEFE
jgi:hypothetical protein